MPCRDLSHVAVAPTSQVPRYSLVDLQALEVHRRRGICELIRFHDIDSVAMKKVRHGRHLAKMSRGHEGIIEQKNRRQIHLQQTQPTAGSTFPTGRIS